MDEVWEELKLYPNYTLNEPAAKLPAAIFEAPPTFGKKPMTWSVEIHDESHLSVVITQVFPFRPRFEARGIQGGRINISEATPKGDYVPEGVGPTRWKNAAQRGSLNLENRVACLGHPPSTIPRFAS